MQELNQLLANLHNEWLNKRPIDLNTLTKLNNLFHALNRKENKPLYLTLTYTYIGHKKTLQGICNYCQLHIDHRLKKNILWCELIIWRKRKKISYGHVKTIKYQKTIQLNIPIINLIALESFNIPPILSQSFST